MKDKKSIDTLFGNIVNQPIAVSILKSSVYKNHIAPAYLFTGPKGVGQKETALRFLEALIQESKYKVSTRKRLEELNHPDLLAIEPTYLNQGQEITKKIAIKENLNFATNPQIRLSQIKSVRYFLSKKPIESRKGMVIIEDIETINESAANALLKTLEEPANGILILISDRPEKLLNTIKSRCQIIPFIGFDHNLLQERLEDYNKSNETTVDLKVHFKNLLNLSNGSPEVLIENFKNLNEIPLHLLEILNNKRRNPLENLSIAKEITDNLTQEKQIWLINWLQQSMWHENLNIEVINRLEKLRDQLNSYVNAKVAWEIALIDLN